MESKESTEKESVLEEQAEEIRLSQKIYLQKRFLIGIGILFVLALLLGGKLLFNNSGTPIQLQRETVPTLTPAPTLIPTVFEERDPSITSLPTRPSSTKGPMGTSTPMPDKEPPVLRGLYFPQPNGVMDYRVEGRYCAIANSAQDNVTQTQDIVISYQFNEGVWTSYAKQNGYYCTDFLSNGPHVLRVKAKDLAGNESGVETHNFTVSISE